MQYKFLKWYVCIFTLRFIKAKAIKNTLLLVCALWKCIGAKSEHIISLRYNQYIKRDGNTSQYKYKSYIRNIHRIYVRFLTQFNPTNDAFIVITIKHCRMPTACQVRINLGGRAGILWSGGSWSQGSIRRGGAGTLYSRGSLSQGSVRGGVGALYRDWQTYTTENITLTQHPWRAEKMVYSFPPIFV